MNHKLNGIAEHTTKVGILELEIKDLKRRIGIVSGLDRDRQSYLPVMKAELVYKMEALSYSEKRLLDLKIELKKM